jgi:hypothetical protein
MKNFPASVYGAELNRIIDLLSRTNTGDVLSYEQISEAAGINILNHRHLLATARKKLLAEQQMVFASENGRGLIRLNSEQTVGVGISTVHKIGRTARRGIKTMAAAEYKDLTEQGKVKYNVGMAVLNLVRHSTSQKSQNRIETGVSTTMPNMIPMKATLELLAK